MTNGDKFREKLAKKSNAEFVDILLGSMCAYCIHDGKNVQKNHARLV